MTETEQIADRLKLLPPILQQEVLDFINFLTQKVAKSEDPQDEADWTRFSLVQAMNGLENEDSPEYGEADLKERWR